MDKLSRRRILRFMKGSWIRSAALGACLLLPVAARAGDDRPAAQPPGGSETHDTAKGRATAGGTRVGPVGPRSSDTLNNGSNAEVGNSTGTAASERMPHAGTPSTDAKRR